MADDARPAAAVRTEIALWPDGPPRTIAGVGPEIAYRAVEGVAEGTRMLRNVSQPTLTVFEPASAMANGVGVIVVPGGGWRILAWEHEGLALARWLNGRGYTAFLLKYRVMGTPADPAEFAAGMARMGAQLAEPRPAAKAPRAMGDLMRDEATLYAR